MDPRIKEAIRDAVRETGQPESLSRKIAQWYHEITSGNEDVSNLESAYRHIDGLFRDVTPTDSSKSARTNSG